jgi:tRNA pseudouridine13 synthase
MKLKCRPEDFRVEELPTIKPVGNGRFTFYRLTKRDIGTIEAVDSICRRWNLAGRRVSYGGLKDRHAVTVQYLTIVEGPRQAITTPHFELEPLGRLAHAFGPQHFRGNRFELVLRDLARADLDRASSEIARLSQDGLPNYFDDQRFGSVGYSGEFIGHAWLIGEYERALKLALAEANPFDRSQAKVQKSILREHWGQWSEAKARLERSSARSIVTYLVDHPADFRGAFARMKRELRTLYFSAFQSHLWNLILARWIERSTEPDQRVNIALKVGQFPFPRRLAPEQVRTLVPDGPLAPVIHDVLTQYQLEWSQLRVKHLKDVFFSKGSRACLTFPEKLEVEAIDDELHVGRHGMRLSFELDRGSYATIMVKRITDAAERIS